MPNRSADSRRTPTPIFSPTRRNAPMGATVPCRTCTKKIRSSNMAVAMLRKIPQKAIMRIQSGSQRFLFFRLRPHKPFARVILFTDGVEPIAVCEILPGELHSESRADLSAHFLRFSGMSYPEWNQLWINSVAGYALEISAYAVIPEELRFNVVDYWRLKQTPQNFVYVPHPGWPLGRPDTMHKPKMGDLL